MCISNLYFQDEPVQEQDWSPVPKRKTEETKSKGKEKGGDKEKEDHEPEPEKSKHVKRPSLTETLRKTVSGAMQRMIPRRRSVTENKRIPAWVPQELVKTWELVLAPEEPSGVKEVDRPIGTNIIGMVGWRMRLFTPELPHGRDVIVIANDITFQMGSFGPDEGIYTP